MAKEKFDFSVMEEKWKKYWEKEKIYAANLSKPVYSIDTPPPTVSGDMHMGHAFSYSQQDFIARYRRMKEGTVFYPFGTDDNGLPTEKLVERLNKVKSKNMTRSEFIKLCLKTLKKITPDFIDEWKNLGVSCDYNAYYSTIDKDSQKISQKMFLDLLKEGAVYQKEFPTIWDTHFQTPVAQAELEDKEKESLFSTIKFECEGKELLIATTRPELLGACVAIFVNPSDKRYNGLVGKSARVPLFNHEVPIVEDESAEIDKGTGVLMICSYGDKYDVDAINRHDLDPRIILNKDGTLNTGEYKGLAIKEARKKVLEDLESAGLIVEQKKITHAVNVYEKSGEEIEFLPTNQWFIKVLDKKKELIKQANKINWYPEYMRKRYDNWVEGLDWDWSISRERHFGIPIPVWNCNVCRELILPQDSELPVDPSEVKKKCPKCKGEAEPETRVLDTWATSSLTPQIASSLVDGKIKLPYSLRPQAHDIIRTWAFYTIVRSYLHEGELPWKNISVSGFVLDPKGAKMSKSKGNVISPKVMMEKYSVDALRFGAATTKLGEDIPFQEKELIAGNKMVKKLMNASKFVFMNLKDYDFKKPKKIEPLDGIFLHKLSEVINEVSKSFEKYEYSKAKLLIEQFFWQDFADNYLEIVKKRVYQGEGNKKKSAQYTLYQSLLAIVKMVAPIMPFISEEIYQEYFKKQEGDKSVHISSWPQLKISDLDKWAVKDWAEMVRVISMIRQEKSKAQKPMNSEIVLTLSEFDYKLLNALHEDLANVMNATEIKEGEFSVEFS